MYRPLIHNNLNKKVCYVGFTVLIYRVIHKPVKHFKNLQQIDYALDHGNSYADGKRNGPSFFFFYIFLQMLNMSTFGNMADIYAIVHLVPHACQHITVDHIC
jgi:hypothetical protein